MSYGKPRDLRLKVSPVLVRRLCPLPGGLVLGPLELELQPRLFAAEAAELG